MEIGAWLVFSPLPPPLPPSLPPSALFGAALHRRYDADNMMPPFIFPRLSLSLNPLLYHWSYLPLLVGALGNVMGGGEEGRERERGGGIREKCQKVVKLRKRDEGEEQKSKGIIRISSLIRAYWGC